MKKLILSLLLLSSVAHANRVEGQITFKLEDSYWIYEDQPADEDQIRDNIRLELMKDARKLCTKKLREDETTFKSTPLANGTFIGRHGSKITGTFVCLI